MSLSSEADAALVDLARAGDRDAFGALYRRHYRTVLGFVGRSVGHHRQMDAEDLTQQAFLRAWEAIDRYEPDIKFSTWLCYIARHMLIDGWRRKYGPAKDEPLPANLRSRDFHQAVERAVDAETELRRVNLDDLPPEHRRVLWLRYGEDMTFNEIAAEMGMTAGAARGLDFRARARLRGRMRG